MRLFAATVLRVLSIIAIAAVFIPGVDRAEMVAWAVLLTVQAMGIEAREAR